MSTEGLHSEPPDWAEALVRNVLEPRHRETVSGDLLEEYRDTIVPALGAGARRWYQKRALGFLWRAVWPWAVAIAAILITRGLLDMLAPTQYTRGVVHPRSRIMSQSLIAVFVTSGFFSAWRFGRIRSGVLVAFFAAVAGGALSVAGSLLSLAVWHDQPQLDAIANSGGLDEMLGGVALILVPVGTWFGAIGACLGMGTAHIVTRPPQPVKRLFDWDRAAWICGGLLALSVIAREWLDWWLSPTQDFYARSVVSTSVGVGLFIAAGLWTGWRARSVRRSAITGMTTGLIAALAIDLVTALQLVVRHDPQTMRAIAASGGVSEAFVLPFVVALFGTVIAMASGALAAGAGWSLDRFRAAR